MPDLDSILRPPFIYLILGVICFSVAVVSTCTGKAYGRYAGWTHRAKEPTQFWWTVALYCLGGVGFIGYFLYEVDKLP